MSQKWQCSVCEKSLSSCSSLTLHMLIHTGKRPHKCTKCSKTFRTKQVLEKHLLRHAGELKYGCSICDKWFLLKEQLDDHMKKHTDELHVCQICKHVFVSKSYLKRHMMQNHNSVCSSRIQNDENPHKCTKCCETFRTKQYLEKKLLRHTVEMKFGCSICEERFFKKQQLDDHMKRHTDEVHICELCDRAFVLKFDLKRHLMTHSGNKTGNKCKSKQDLNNHTEKCTPNINCEIAYQCLECGTFLDQMYVLKRHLGQHGGDVLQSHKTNDSIAFEEHLFKCSQCDQVSSKKLDNKRHSEKNPHLSEICNAGNSAATVNRSMIVSANTAKQIHKCKDCGKAFRNPGRLKVHVRKHTGEMPHECSLCKKRFRRMRRWKHHVLNECWLDHRVNIMQCFQKVPDVDRRKKSLDVVRRKTRLDVVRRKKRLDMFRKTFSVWCTDNTLKRGNFGKCESTMLAFDKDTLVETFRGEHAKEKPFSCVQCGATYCSKKSVSRHIKVKHGISYNMSEILL